VSRNTDNNDSSTLADALGERPTRRRGRGGSGGVTRRGVRLQLTLFLVFGAAAGLLAVFITTGSDPVTYVARAEQALAGGQILDVETWGGIDVVPLPPEAVEPGAFSGETVSEVLDLLRSSITGEATLYPVAAGQQLRPEHFTGYGSGAPIRGLMPDERQISITARAARAVAGTIRPGDRVDVYAVTGDGVAGLLGQNVEIVAVSLPPDSLESAAAGQIDSRESNLSDYVPSNPIGGTYVLKVKAGDAVRYFAADTGGTIYLAIRGTDALDTQVDPTNATIAICAQSASAACRGR
jgi:Flp pilus assembly protein CpaB